MNKLAGLGKTEQTLVAETMLAILTTDSYEEAAEKLGMTREGLRKRREKYELDERIAEIPEEALAKLQAHSVVAANVFVKNLKNPRKEMEAAKEVLNRVGVDGKQPQILQQFNIGGKMDLDFIGRKDGK